MTRSVVSVCLVSLLSTVGAGAQEHTIIALSSTLR